MLPQLAFPPRRLPGFDDTPRDGYYPHYGTPSVEMRLPPLPYRNAHTHHTASQPRTSALAPPQVPFPVESNGHPSTKPRSYQISHPIGKHVHDNAEHMLRRKTPNGTLAAGYDGTPVHWSNKPSAPKHMLLMASNAPSTSTYASPAASTGQGFDQGRQHHSNGNLLNGAVVDGNLYTGGDVAGRAFLPPMSYGLNNIFDQIQVPLGATPGSVNGFQIPTVLQPTFPQVPGPTASNEAGFVGPFWPDGRFGAIRLDAVQNANRFNVPVGPGTPEYAYQGHPELYSQRALDRSMYGDNLLHAGPRAGLFSNTENHSLSVPVTYPTASPSIQHGHTPDPYMNGSQQTHRHSISGAAQFKERVLLKAHSTYVELLALLQQIRKLNRSIDRSSGQSNYPRMAIYPKPPRLPSAVFGSHQASGIIGQHLSMNESPTSDGSINTAFPQSSGNLIGATAYDLAQRRTNLAAQAQSCLQILGTLCEQSGWCWVEGMLLGGCLSYGLDAFNMAVDWFSKIATLDPNHVEALSNLAIALFAMNRREEAEQYWLRAVKLRPSYFDAVEHLIGLLCADGRGHEAINIIDFVERTLRIPIHEDVHDQLSDTSSDERSSIDSTGAVSDRISFDYERDSRTLSPLGGHVEIASQNNGFGSSGYSIPACENYKILALVHAKGNLLYTLGDISGASRAFEDAVLIAAGRRASGIQGLIRRILNAVRRDGHLTPRDRQGLLPNPVPHASPLLLPPEKALQTAKLVFAKQGELPGLRYVPEGTHRKNAISTTSNSLLSLAKIFQDEMTNPSQSRRMSGRPTSVSDILALYYLSLSLQPSPSTANNVGILLASVPSPSPQRTVSTRDSSIPNIPGVVPGSGIALALAYYNYGLNLDSRHAHLYTNLGSLLKDIGQLTAAIKMYEQAVDCDGNFDIALANLANAVKDQGRVKDAIKYYRQAVHANPDFAEAVCGLANALNSVCDWAGRGGVFLHNGTYDRWHVDDSGMLVDVRLQGATEGWMKRVVDIVERQLSEGSNWGRGVLRSQDDMVTQLLVQLQNSEMGRSWHAEKFRSVKMMLMSWVGQRWEGARVVRLVERAVKRTMHRWYRDKYVLNKHLPASYYPRPQLPGSLSVPSAPTVLPFHTFTCPLTARDVRMISQRNALRISCQTLKSSWLPTHVYPPPPPPNPHLNIGYVSSDFNNHPLSHLMQSVFGFHDPSRAKAFCYATTASDNSIHRQQIEREAPVFHDVSSWSAEKLLNQIVLDGIHILVNLNGYTRGARNDIFAARAVPVQMSFMGFAGTLGAEWCDYLVADETAIPRDTLRPHRGNVTLEDLAHGDDEGEWVYSENIVFTRDTFFCCDHAQSSPSSSLTWDEEQRDRWKMRKELFPGLSDDAIILGNFNQLYKIDPTTFRTWLRILSQVPKAIIWLLRFPDLGESNLKQMARKWGNEEIASRIWFTDVAPKQQHISRARVCDLFLDTAECNAHTTAADVLWSSTPILTLPRYRYKMCSRMAASILKGALPKTPEGVQAVSELVAVDDSQYENFAIKLARGYSFEMSSSGYYKGVGRLAELRRMLYDNRWKCGLFNTRRWVGAIEDSYEEAWRKWVADEGGDIDL